MSKLETKSLKATDLKPDPEAKCLAAKSREASSLGAQASSLLLTLQESTSLDPDSPQGKDWEDLVAKNPSSGFMQSLHWARFKASSEQSVMHLLITSDQEEPEADSKNRIRLAACAPRLVAGALLYSCPHEKRPTILLSPYGPVLPWDDPELARRCLRMILDKTIEISQRINAVTLRIEPRIPVPAPSLLNEFAPAPVNLVPAETLLLDLSQDLDRLLAQMKPKCRYNIALAERRGVTVREESGPDAATILYSRLKEAADRDDFYLESESFFQNFMRTLMPSGMLKLFVAEHENDVLGCLVLITHGAKATYLYGGISNQKRQFMPGYALQWQAIQEAKDSGCLSYDFYGYDQFQSPGNPYARFSRFKSGFGGTPMRFIGGQDYMFMDKLVDNVIGFFQDVL